ncbi:TlpA family protein disulfide reductase [Paracoccus pacificus]|uniref:TlpA family protein disulfide reductase n=1 Tax=Paracoccus pacificus TaxID=1463598 RepID=A0ABW4R1R4_9RHOB
MLRSLFLYTALVIGANATLAAPIDWTAPRAGDMAKLEPVDPPVAASTTAFFDESGAEKTLADYKGKVVLLNFWATWCAPCREEMPSIQKLQAEMGGDDFEVVPIASGRNPLPAIRKFFGETGVTDLPILTDPRQKLSRDMGVLSLPVTILLDREGREIARLIGGAEWDTPEARAIIQQAIAP